MAQPSPSTPQTTLEPVQKSGENNALEVAKNSNGEKLGAIDRFRVGFRNLIDTIRQPALNKIEHFQEAEKGLDAFKFREKVTQVVDSKTYRWFDKWMLTYGSVFGMLGLKVTTANTISDEDAQNIIDAANTCFLAGFSVDMIANTVAKGTSYFFKVEEDEANPNRKKLQWQSAPIINLISILGAAAANSFSHARLARLVKLSRLSRVARLAKISNIQNSLEGESHEKINSSFSRFILEFLGGLALLVNPEDFDNRDAKDVLRQFAALAWITWRINEFNQGVRATINNTFTRRFKAAEEAIVNQLGANKQLKFLAEKFMEEKEDEVALLEDRVIDLFKLSSGLLNPFEEDLQLGKNGEILPKDIEASVLMSDLRNFTPLIEAHGTEVVPVLTEYFSDILQVIKECGGRLLKGTGDGLIAYFKDNGDQKEVSAMKCAVKIKPITDKYNQILQTKFHVELSDKDEQRIRSENSHLEEDEVTKLLERTEVQINDHSSGIAMSSGTILLADLFSKRNVEPGEQAEVESPDLFGTPIGRSARLESMSKKYPDHYFLITEDELFGRMKDDPKRENSGEFTFEVKPLPKELADCFVELGIENLKGVGPKWVYGLPKSFTTENFDHLNESMPKRSSITTIDELQAEAVPTSEQQQAVVTEEAEA